MKYRQLGRTAFLVSEIGFGCWPIGGTSYGPTHDDESLAALETAWEHGVNFFDTADTYGHGHSETLLAQFLKDKPREKVILATKVGWDFYHGGSRKNFDPGYLRFACDESLKRLQIDTIDLYQLHNPSLDLIRQGDAVRVLDDLRRQGKIRFIGISIHREEEGIAAIHDGRVDTLQLVFNLLDQRMARTVLPEAKKNHIGVIAREPLACGVLSGKYKADHQFTKDDHRRRWPREKLELDLKKVEALRAVFPTNCLSLTRAALEYILEFDTISTVIPGAKTKVQTEENIMASEDPKLGIGEASLFRDLYHREEIFKQGIGRQA